MSEKDNSVPPLSLEIERARVKCSLVIRACARGIVRAFKEWFRSLVLRSIQLARRLAAKRRIYIDIRELQQLDHRMLADIGITMDKSAKFDGQIAAAHSRAVTFLRQ
jgi:uncharacterized protein YjiS (DUF1127 family)